MPEKSFQFKQFTVWHDRCRMKVGTDGVLLGAWVQPDNAKQILDIGTGTGLIALMLAQKSKNEVQIDALEIDPSASKQAMENVEKSPWSGKINIINNSLQEYAVKSKKSYDLIVSNPPYFQLSSNPINRTHNTAKHAVSLSLDELLEGVCNFLNKDGGLYIILPVDRAILFSKLADNKSLFCTRRVFIKPNYYKPYERVLLKFSFNAIAQKVDEVLLIEKEIRHQYSDGYKLLTKDYYLAF